MASDSGIDSQSSPELEEAPMSRTHQYRHHIKPLLERKRRARINKCVDELKVEQINMSRANIICDLAGPHGGSSTQGRGEHHQAGEGGCVR